MCSFTKKLQLLGDFVPQTLYRGFLPGPSWGTSIPQTHSLLLCPTPLLIIAAMILINRQCLNTDAVIKCTALALSFTQSAVAKLKFSQIVYALPCTKLIEFNICYL